ncbi:hypothetical protein DL98DRAFT_660597 [Cadophora sp. DSE1049]|nr:hypothetical protein DL98DRAFT_660597 [Cadophora sp. DSE1049]
MSKSSPPPPPKSILDLSTPSITVSIPLQEALVVDSPLHGALWMLEDVRLDVEPHTLVDGAPPTFGAKRQANIADPIGYLRSAFWRSDTVHHDNRDIRSPRNMPKQSGASALKVGIIQVYTTPESWGQEMLDSIATSIKAKIPASSTSNPQGLRSHSPDRRTSQSDRQGGELRSWVVDVLNLIRDINSEENKTKVLGICWGHQAVALALGGVLASLDSPNAGVEDIRLTEAGRKLFGQSSLKLSKFHKRVVSLPPPDFHVLAASNEILITGSKTFLTFQSHPEIYGSMGLAILDSDKEGYYTKGKTGADSEVVRSVRRKVGESDDGGVAWEAIMRWVVC